MTGDDWALVVVSIGTALAVLRRAPRSSKERERREKHERRILLGMKAFTFFGLFIIGGVFFYLVIRELFMPN